MLSIVGYHGPEADGRGPQLQARSDSVRVTPLPHLQIRLRPGLQPEEDPVDSPAWRRRLPNQVAGPSSGPLSAAGEGPDEEEAQAEREGGPAICADVERGQDYVRQGRHVGAEMY